MANLRVISADSHVMEPAGLWQERLDQKFRDQAPRVVKNENRPGYLFTAPGMTPFPAAGGFAIGKSGDELKEHLKKGYEAARPSGWDPAERHERSGRGWRRGGGAVHHARECRSSGSRTPTCSAHAFSVYNDWLAEFCSLQSEAPDRTRVDFARRTFATASRSFNAAAKAGLRGAMIWGSPPEDKPYGIKIYDPFWQAASELQMPLASAYRQQAMVPKVRREARSGDGSDQVRRTPANLMESYGNMVQEVQRSLNSLIFGGVLERFPKLRLVSAESDVGWMPHFMYRLDHAYEKFSRLVPDPIPMRPSEYIRRQVWATFQDDPVGPAAYKLFGADNYMWASDFPHADSTWPHSREVIARDFDGVPEDITRKIVFENCVKLYHLDI